MQPTDAQVERSLDYLRTTAQTRRESMHAALLEARRQVSSPAASSTTDADGAGDADVAGFASVDAAPAVLTRTDLPDGLMERIESAPWVRDERLAEARQRYYEGSQPDADALAARMVGRLVCDRLR